MLGRIQDAIQMVNERFAKTPSLKEFSPTGFRTDAERRHPDAVMGTAGLDPSRAEWGGGDRTGWKTSFVGDWVKPHQKSMQLLPQQFTYSPATSHQHSTPNTTTAHPLSPLFSPHSSQPMTLESLAHHRISPYVGDWLAEKERNKQRGLEEKPCVWKREREEEMVEPFIPPVHTIESNRRRDISEGVLQRGNDHPELQRPEFQRRAYSQPIAARKSTASFHGISESPPGFRNSPFYHQTPPDSNSPVYHTQTSGLPNTSIHHQPPSNHQPFPVYVQPNIAMGPQRHDTPYVTPPQPIIYQYTPTTKIYIKSHKKKGKEKHRTGRGKEKSAKQSRRIPSPDGVYDVGYWKEPRNPRWDSDDEDDSPAPITPPNQASPIHPPTTVVYYNQQNQHHQSPPSFSSPHHSPPQNGQVYDQPPMWVQPATTMHISHHVTVGGHTQMAAPGRFSSPMPMIYPDYHHPVIPPQDHTKSEKTGSLSKWMSSLKI